MEQQGDDIFPIDPEEIRAYEEKTGRDAAIAEQVEEKLAAESDDKPKEKPDPYLLADAHYIEKDARWRNKQRTLCFASRGTLKRFRRLVDNVKRLLPHNKAEPKFE